MASTFTPNKNYEEMATGEDAGTWGTKTNANWSLVDSNFGGLVSLVLSNADVTLNAAQASNLLYICSGVLTANVNIVFPAVGGFYYIVNATTGNFSLSIQASGGPQFYLSPSSYPPIPVVCDSISFYYMAGVAPPGNVIDFAGTTLPAGFLYCDGAAYSRARYKPLYDQIGTAWGVGDGSTTFNVPDLRGRAAFGRDNMGGVTAGRISVAGGNYDGTLLGANGGQQNHTQTLAEMAAHTHAATVTDPGHHHTDFAITTGSDISKVAPQQYTGGAGITGTSTTGITVANSSSGASSPFTILNPSAIVNKIIKI